MHAQYKSDDPICEFTDNSPQTDKKPLKKFKSPFTRSHMSKNEKQAEREKERKKKCCKTWLFFHCRK